MARLPLLVAAALMNGCALIVGDVHGDAVLGRDAAIDVRRSSPTDAAPADAVHPHDAGRDTEADARVPFDASRIDGGKDGKAPGFCASEGTPDGATFFLCEDFDEAADASSAGALSLGPGTVVAIESDASTSPPSPPSALYMSVMEASSGAVSHPIPGGSTVVLTMDLMLDFGAQSTGAGNTYVSLFQFASGVHVSNTALKVGPGPMGGVGKAIFVATYTADGGMDNVPGSSAFTIPVGWVHPLKLTFTTSDAGVVSYALALDQVVVVPSTTLPDGFIIKDGGALILGISLTNSQQTHHLYFDNVEVAVLP